MIHHSHLPLRKWFWAVYLVACDKREISALALAAKIEVCYETAWNMLRRIRKSMELRDADYMLSGIVEFDDSYFVRKLRENRGVEQEIRAYLLLFQKIKRDALNT